MNSSMFPWYAAPEQNRYLYDDFCTSLTLMSSAAYSVDHAKLLMDDITTTRCFYLVMLYKYNGDEEASYGSFYERQNHKYFPYIEIDAIDIARFLRDKVALRYGNLEILQWTRAKGCPWNGRTSCAKAANYGHVEVLQWLRANGCPWNEESTCNEAASGGHLGVLQWLRNSGCPWDESTCAGAAGNGQLEVLQWLRDNGCPWDASTVQEAARNGHLC